MVSNGIAPNAPIPDASVGVAMPKKIESRTQMTRSNSGMTDTKTSSISLAVTFPD